MKMVAENRYYSIRNQMLVKSTLFVLLRKVMSLIVRICLHNGSGMLISNEKWMFCNGQNGYIRLYSYPVTDSYRNLWDVPNLLLQKISAPNFTATTKLTFKPTKKYTGERTGLVVMGLDYAGLFVENTKDGLVLSQSVCDEADRGSLGKKPMHPFLWKGIRFI